MKTEKFTPSYDILKEKLNTLKSILPEAFEDGNIDFASLKESLGEFLENEDREEHYAFTWPGKRQAKQLTVKPPQGTLIPANGEGIDEANTGNLFIEGDNLEVLKILQKTYARKIKMIYIDPPYNTGNDFIYTDNFTQPVEDYLKLSKQVDEEGNPLVANTRADGRFHTKWLNMMYPRLILGRNLLMDDGVIFISIDDNEAGNLRKMCDEIFGEENFVADIGVVNNLKGRNDKKYIATANERVFMYVKHESFNEYGLDLTPKMLGEYTEEDKTGKYRLIELRKRGGADTRAERPRMYYPFYVNPQNGNVSLTKTSEHSVEALPVKSDGVDGRWRWGTDTAKVNLDFLLGKPVQGTTRYNVYEKDYLEQDGQIRRIKPKSVMSAAAYSTDGATKQYRALMGDIGFDNPKPVPFLQDLIEYSTSPESGSIILDFFSGSATTAQAVLDLNEKDNGNRRFILVQLPEVCQPTSKSYKSGYKTIADIGKERIRRAIKKIQEEPASSSATVARERLDHGFKVYKLARSNFKSWSDYSGSDIKELMTLFSKQEDTLLDEWQEKDLIAEVMLQEGFPLTSSKIKVETITENTVWKLSSNFCEHSLYVCLDKSVKHKTLENLALAEKDIFICLDTAINDEDKVRLSDKGLIKTI